MLARLYIINPAKTYYCIIREYNRLFVTTVPTALATHFILSHTIGLYIVDYNESLHFFSTLKIPTLKIKIVCMNSNVIN
jgi:hypothetical protein